MTAAPHARAAPALAALAAIVAITASWWALALWPLGGAAPDWIVRTREVCFGAAVDRLPTAAGWLVLIGPPAGMVALLAAVWGTELRAGLKAMTANTAGQLAFGVVLALMAVGLTGVAVRVRTVAQEPFDTGTGAAGLTRVNDVAAGFALTDEAGREVTLASYRGRPVIVTFAYAHCETVCPLIVADVIAARRRLGDDAPDALVVTLDPWRDTPSRLPTIARTWELDAGAHLLSGPVETVERALNAWRVPRTRNQKTGDITHPSIVYIVAADGRIRYVVTGGAETIAAAVRAL
jgi:protein SCO1/2